MDDLASQYPTQPYRVGDRVRQPLFGNGTVKALHDSHITIDFDIRGERTFLMSKVELSPATAPTDREKRATRP